MAQADLTRVASNIGALNSLWALQNINKQLGVHQTRLSTGKRINSAADDPAGLTIATKLDARAQGLKVALDNIGDAKNLLAVAEGGIGRISDIIIQMKNKAAQAASDTMGTAERSAIKEQLEAYVKQVDDIVAQTSWNGNKLIDGSKDAGVLTFQTGADSGDVTQVNGIKNLYASTQENTYGDSLKLASRGGGAKSLSGVMDAGDILTDGSEVAMDAVPANVTISSGQYQVKLTNVVRASAGDGGAVTSATLQLQRVDGTLVAISDAADGSGALNETVTGAAIVDVLNGGGAYDFGNGITVDLKDGIAAGVGYTAAFTVEEGGNTYSLTSLGGLGVGDSYTNRAGASKIAVALGDAQSYADLLWYLEDKLDSVNEMMAKVGAFTGRLTFKEDQVTAAQINVEASYNRIMNANMAEEQVNASKYLILQQTSIAMLAQANQSPQFLLSLFR